MHTLRSRRGVTLAEIIVALALVTVMITMVVSFTFLITERTKANAANDAMRRDCMLLEAGVERWIDAFSEKGVTLGFDEATKRPSAYGKFYLGFANGALTGQLSDSDSFTVRTETVRSVTFEFAGGDDEVLICNVKCINPQTEEEVDFTFCVYSRLGKYGGGINAETTAP